MQSSQTETFHANRLWTRLVQPVQRDQTETDRQSPGNGDEERRVKEKLTPKPMQIAQSSALPPSCQATPTIPLPSSDNPRIQTQGYSA